MRGEVCSSSQTVGALLSRAYTSGGCILGELFNRPTISSGYVLLSLFAFSYDAGSIFGTGTNGAYVERVENIKKLGDSDARKKGGYMVVNTEWGAFNNTVRTSRK